MNAIPSILIFDVGKTNKKIILFDEGYQIIHEEAFQFPETVDEDGFPCEDIGSLTEWIKSSFKRIITDARFDVQAVNFSAYGASFVYLDERLNVVSPLYNYLKPYPEGLKQKFYETYGGERYFSKLSASPSLGSLNSGLQLYRIKQEQPDVFRKIRYAVHLPQYLSTVLTGLPYSEITSIGCHTNLWNYTSNDYHEWVFKEGIKPKLAPILRSDECTVTNVGSRSICIGIGLHDSSSALIPYLTTFHEPFILLSTGTWCITLNPFNHSPLTQHELENDCLCYFNYQGSPVKASRIFAGYEHDQQTKRLAKYYNMPIEYFTKLEYNLDRARKLDALSVYGTTVQQGKGEFLFADRDLSEFTESEEAYHDLLIDIVTRQLMSTRLVQKDSSVKRMFVDGGFSQNRIYMNLMAAVFAELNVYAASVAQASALGAALVIHKYWNKRSLPTNLIDLKFYADAAKDLEGLEGSIL